LWGAGGRECPLGSGHVATADDAANEAALAILADHLRGDFPPRVLRRCTMADGKGRRRS